MSDTMLIGVLSMPFDMVMQDDLSRMQFYSRAQEAATRIESDAVLIEKLKEQIATLCYQAGRESVQKENNEVSSSLTKGD